MIKDVSQGGKQTRIAVDTKTYLGRIYKQGREYERYTLLPVKRGRFRDCSHLAGALLDSCPRAFLIAEYAGSVQTRQP